MKSKWHITWEEIRNELYTKLSESNIRLANGYIIYGVPTGGMILTSVLQSMDFDCIITHDPREANLILDDILDSGKTRDFYKEKFPDTEFFALFNKEVEPELKDIWLVFPWEQDHPAGEQSDIQQNIVRQLEYIGEDPKREGLLDTPRRIVKSWNEIYSGYSIKPEDVLTTFSADGYDQMILLKNVEMYSMCEHHNLPFVGKAHIAYIPKPDGKIVGISKLARLLEIYSRRMQIQERIGEQVTSSIMELLDPLGAACIIEADHFCMRMRGVNKQQSTMVTSSLIGVFKSQISAREELMSLIK